MASFKLVSQLAAGITAIEVADPAEGSTSPLLFLGHRLHFEHWGSKEPGAYVLIDPVPTQDGQYRMYVGESTRAGVAGRISQHVNGPPKGMERWQFAVGIRGELVGGKEDRLMFEHAQGLESELYDELSRASCVVLMNKGEPSKIPLTKPDHQKLDNFTKCCLDLLEYLGYHLNSRPDKGVLRKLRAGQQQEIVDPPPFPQPAPPPVQPTPTTPSSSPTSQRPPSSPKRPSAKRGELAAMIQAGVVQVGTKLVNKGKKHACEAEIVDAAGHIQVLRYGKDEHGNWKHELADNPKYRFKSLNGSTQAIVDLSDRKAGIDGWEFWRLADDPTVSMKQLKGRHRDHFGDSDHPTPSSSKPSSIRGSELASMIEAGVVQVGTRLVARGKKHACEAEIVDAAGHIQVLRYGKDEHGNWKHELADNPKYRFKSLNGATKVANEFSDRKASIDGWEFWRLSTDPKISMKDIKEQYRSQSKE